MTLYTQKSANIRRTWFLVILFFIIVIAVGWALSYIYNNPGILYIAVIFSVVMNIIAYWNSDKIVLAMSKAKLVEKKDNPELYNIVENLAITAGLPAPRIYIVKESQPNAFATGRNPKHSVIAVTEGLLNKLDRSELEAVIAHELSHIGNRDMLLSTMVVVLVGFISITSDIFLRSTIFGGLRRSNNRAGGVLALVGIALMILAPISAVLIQMAISRKREFLADASGALLTRYPDALISALQKISSDSTPMKVANNTTAHLWLSSPFKDGKRISKIHKLFMTHPPIEDRIKALRGTKMELVNQ